MNDQTSKKDIPPVKPLKSLPLSDNFMFGAVMSNPEVCTLFLEEVLQKRIIRLAFVNSEQTIANIPGLHGIRLDVFVEDEAHNRYDIEMQARGSVYAKHLESRVRFYQSSIDRDFLTSGGAYMDLPLSYIIFVCDYDYFGRGLARYERVSSIKDCPDLPYEDGTHVIFFNTRYTVQNVSRDIREYLDYIRTNDDQMPLEGDLARTARALVHRVRNDRTMEVRYMTMQMYLDEKLKERFDEVTEIARAKGIAEGREVGWEEGRKEGRQEGRQEGREVGRQEGREVGRQEGTAEGKAVMLKSAICTVADTFSPKELAQRFHISENFVYQILQEAGITPKL